MEKLTSQKIEKWETKDYVKTALLYVGNSVLFALIYVFISYIRALLVESVEFEFFDNFEKSLNFFAISFIFVSVVYLYNYFGNRDFLKKASNSEMLFLIMQVSMVIVIVADLTISSFIRPIAMVALLSLFLTDERISVFITLIYCMFQFFLDIFLRSPYASPIFSSFSFEMVYFVVMGIAENVLAIYLMKKVYSRLKMLLYSLFLSIPAIFCILVQSAYQDLIHVLIACAYGIFTGPFSVCCFIILLPIFEGLFKKTSAFKLAELTNHKAPIIANLIEKAPGTFNHAVVVSNLAEACATAIDEDPLFAKTCAYYHDMGKLRRPEYFKENQTGVDFHEELTAELSANIIKSHTEDGYKLALKHRIPVEIANVIREHHGTMPVIYFYEKAKKYKDGEVNINAFSYPGPKPQSKIAAIIMIADGCEAAARTLKDRSREKVEEIVDKIINQRMELGQLEDCELTLKDIHIISETIVNSLTGVYHKRTEYPTLKITRQMKKQSKEQKEEK